MPVPENALAAACAAILGAIFVLSGVSSAAAIGESAEVHMKGVDGKDLGNVTIVETMSGVLLKVNLKGLPPGAHGFHFHATGTCEGDFSSAGGIYNPFGAQHGFLNVEGPMPGDLPNLVVSPAGEALAEIVNSGVTLNKSAEETLLDADGASLVIFEGPDDHLTGPEGNAGTRLACGVIGDVKGGVQTSSPQQ